MFFVIGLHGLHGLVRQVGLKNPLNLFNPMIKTIFDNPPWIFVVHPIGVMGKGFIQLCLCIKIPMRVNFTL